MSTDRPNEPVWLRAEPATRSPRFSRTRIAEAAMALADREGIEALSMRRVAAELGAGTMTLYHYVQNKDELLELMNDAMMGDLLVPDKEVSSADWRRGLAAIARASLEVFRSHGWLLDPAARIEAFGPNGMRHFEQSMAAAAGTGLPVEQRLEVISQVDDYVFGFVLRETEVLSSPDGEGWEAQIAPMSDFISEQVATGDYPHIADFLGSDPFPVVVRRMVDSMTSDQRFDRGLERLLDGVAAEIERYESGP